MKILDQVEKSLNDTLESLQCTLKLLNESKEDKVLEDSSKYDKEMTEEEKKIYEEAYVKVGEPLPNSCLRSYTSGDWIRMWLEPYQRKQIVDVFFPLVDYLLKDECAERPQFNQYNRYKIYEVLHTITSSMFNKPLKEDKDTQWKLCELLIKIFPKNREVFWKTISEVDRVFSTKLSEQTSLTIFIQDQKTKLKDNLASIKKRYEDDFKKISNYYYKIKDTKLYSTLYGITCRFNEIDIYSDDKDKLISIFEKIEYLLRIDKNEEHKEIFRKFYDEIENMLL